VSFSHHLDPPSDSVTSSGEHSAGTMTTNWLDLMDNDSNISMTDDENTRPALDRGASRSSFDAELDSSRCGVNLLIRKNMNILSEDSLSRKRSLNEMKSTDIDRFIAKMSGSPPKAKQKVDAEGRWTKTKTASKNETAKIGFDRFLNWAERGKSGNTNRCVLSTTSIDNKRNIRNNRTSGNLVTCTPMATNRRTQFRGRRNRKRALRNTHSVAPAAAPRERIEAERGGDGDDEDEDEDMDLDPEGDGATKLDDGDGERARGQETATDTTLDSGVAAQRGPRPEPAVEPEPQSESKRADEVAVAVLAADAVEAAAAGDAPNDDGPAHSEEAARMSPHGAGSGDEGDEDEDDDLAAARQRATGGRSARVTPKLEKVVFSESLLLFSKVPILKKVDSEPVLKGPVFLNADEFQERYPEKAKLLKPGGAEKAAGDGHGDDDDSDVGGESTDGIKSDSDSTKSGSADSGGQKDGEWAAADLLTPSKSGSTSWASRLFGSARSTASAKRAPPRNRTLSEKSSPRRRSSFVAEPSPLESAKSPLSGRESVRRSTPCSPTMCSPKSSKSSTASLSIVVPSQDATEWRQKQISYGKNTVGYRNFVRKFPDKALVFRHLNGLVSTPDAKEKIGKKRWVGKYQKWRKFLHRFDSPSSSDSD